MLISQISLDTNCGGTYNRTRQLTKQLVSNAKKLMLESPKLLTHTLGDSAVKDWDRHPLPWRNPGVSCRNPGFFFRRKLQKRQKLDNPSEI